MGAAAFLGVAFFAAGLAPTFFFGAAFLTVALGLGAAFALGVVTFLGAAFFGVVAFLGAAFLGAAFLGAGEAAAAATGAAFFAAGFLATATFTGFGAAGAFPKSLLILKEALIFKNFPVSTAFFKALRSKCYSMMGRESLTKK